MKGKPKKYSPPGNGNGAFLPDMTEEEYERYVHEESNGWRKFYKKVTGV